jgi:hypothetical protein
VKRPEKQIRRAYTMMAGRNALLQFLDGPRRRKAASTHRGLVSSASIMRRRTASSGLVLRLRIADIIRLRASVLTIIPVQSHALARVNFVHVSGHQV